MADTINSKAGGAFAPDTDRPQDTLIDRGADTDKEASYPPADKTTSKAGEGKNASPAPQTQTETESEASENVQMQEASPSTDESALIDGAPTESASSTLEPVASPLDPNAALAEGGLGFWPGIVIAFIAGGAVFISIAKLIRRSALFRAIACKRTPRLKGLTVQGVGMRENQQDALLLSNSDFYKSKGVLMCMADGMGGLQNGELMSRTAVSAAASTFSAADAVDPKRLIISMLQSASSAVNMLVSPNYGSGGTTMLLGLLYDGQFYFSSVGDSRICLCRDGELFHLNRQHIFEEELLLEHLNGKLSYDNATTYKKRGAVTSYLGMGTLKYFDYPSGQISIRKGDRFILMSDGVFNTLSDKELIRILSQRPGAIAARLTSAVEKKQHPYQDNYSAVIVAVE